MKDIIWIKSKSRLSCHKCDIKKLCNYAPTEKIEVLGPCNDKFGYYKFNNPEPEKIQTRYEWMDERYKLLDNGPKDKEFDDEFNKLSRWLSINKPEQWETATKDNIKAEDIVRNKETQQKLLITYVFESGLCFIGKTACKMEDVNETSKFEIDTYKNSD